jgi:hypothetical protein
MTTSYTAEQLQAAYDRAYADVRREYAEDLPKILADAGCKSVEDLVWKCEKYERLLRAVEHSALRSPNMGIPDSLLSQIQETIRQKDSTP